MAKKILLSAGCSWTDKSFYSWDESIDDSQRGGWPMWPEIVADKANLKSVNLGKCGTNNKSIFDSIVDYIVTNNTDSIEMIIVVWTDWDRFSKMGLASQYPISSLMLQSLEKFDKHREVHNINDYSKFFISLSRKEMETYSRYTIDTSLRYMFILSTILKSRNISYKFFQGLGPFPINISTEIEEMVSYTSDDILSDVIDSAYFNDLKKDKNIIGFPFFKFMNGKTIEELIHQKQNLEISDLDPHPNDLGQKIIAQHIIQKYEMRVF